MDTFTAPPVIIPVERSRAKKISRRQPEIIESRVFMSDLAGSEYIRVPNNNIQSLFRFMTVFNTTTNTINLQVNGIVFKTIGKNSVMTVPIPKDFFEGFTVAWTGTDTSTKLLSIFFSLENLGYNFNTGVWSSTVAIDQTVPGVSNAVQLIGSNFEQGTGSAVPNKAVYVGGKKTDGNLQGLTLVAQGSNPADAEQILGISSLFSSGSSWYREEALGGLSDSYGGMNSNGSGMLAFNGIYFDRWRNNTDGTLLASAARTVTTASPNQVNFNAKGVIVWLNITAVPGVDTISLWIRGTDSLSGVSPTLLESAAFSTTGMRTFIVYPGTGAIAASVTGVSGFPLPRAWAISVVHSGAGSFTYSAGYALIL